MGDLALKLSPKQKDLLQIVGLLTTAAGVDGVYLFGQDRRTVKSLHRHAFLVYDEHSKMRITEAGRQALEES